ncbi:YadA C-terminal domain-containing protein [Photorhabdus luminescens]|uniref:Uncharacterized protein n=1 Tax=Photorhabdus luminescens subsp. mexicana TaxID=2100167 RepID=A0A4R4IPX2_PHOLU|nr:YadA C-terminal domain-containing protein [Photorhabdus luminescens]TDB42690.1 hypothetical protein C5468_24465 [Photorhabdus luminescens subsp. mexicana]
MTWINHKLDARIEEDHQTLASANSYTNKRFRELKDHIDRNEKLANASTTSAIVSIPYLNAQSGFCVALGVYHDQSTIAVGTTYSINSNTNAPEHFIEFF